MTANKEVQKLDTLVTKSKRRLLTIHAVFPFDFFPDTLHIDENKVDLIHRPFFFEKHMFPILLSNINSVVLTTNLFFATLTFEVTGYETNPHPIRYLWHTDAIKARRIIIGLIAAAKEGIDLSQVSMKELRAKVEEIGKSQEHKNI